MVDFNYFVPEEFPSMREDEIEPLRSRFTVTYNTVLNLVRKYSDEEIRDILRKNFATFQGERQRERWQLKRWSGRGQRLEALEREGADGKARRSAAAQGAGAGAGLGQAVAGGAVRAGSSRPSGACWRSWTTSGTAS